MRASSPVRVTPKTSRTTFTYSSSVSCQTRAGANDFCAGLQVAVSPVGGAPPPPAPPPPPTGGAPLPPPGPGGVSPSWVDFPRIWPEQPAIAVSRAAQRNKALGMTASLEIAWFRLGTRRAPGECSWVSPGAPACQSRRVSLGIVSPALLVVTAACAVLALGSAVGSVRSLRRRRPLAFSMRSLSTLLFSAACGLCVVVAMATQGYRALTREDVAVEVHVEPAGPQAFVA